MAYSHIGHDCHVEDDVTFANNATLAGHVHIGQGVIFGGLSAVQQYGRVGKGAMIGGVIRGEHRRHPVRHGDG